MLRGIVRGRARTGRRDP